MELSSFRLILEGLVKQKKLKKLFFSVFNTKALRESNTKLILKEEKELAGYGE